MAGVGHVFVMQGDLTQLAVDGVAIPASDDRRARKHWKRFVPLTSFHWAADTAHVSEPARVEGIAVRYVESGFSDADANVNALGERVGAGLDALAGDVAAHPSRRARPLIGIPLFGTGAGGFDGVRGEALDEVLGRAWDAVGRHEVDVVIVCRDRSDYTALQSRAERRIPPTAASIHHEEATRLGALARSGRLVLFLGAGVSMAAGLPGYMALLQLIDPDAKIEQNEEPADVADRILATLDPDLVRRRIVKAVAADGGYSLAHGLLASMRVADAVTTNFDELYERAAAATFGPEQVVVLPWDAFGDRRAYLLKLHGDPKRDEKFVLSRAHFQQFAQSHASETAILRALPLLGRELVFMGYSMRDTSVLDVLNETYLDHARHGGDAPRVATVLDINASEHRTAGQRVDLGLNVERGTDLDGARQLEIFLDLMAAEAAQQEQSWLLDDRYRALVKSGADRAAVETVSQLVVPEGSTWKGLRDYLAHLGRRNLRA